MESRMVKFYSKDSSSLAVHAMPGHFATRHSHINRSLECIRYYGGIVEFTGVIFSTVDEVDGVAVERLFDRSDAVNYEASPVSECPFCKKGHAIEAMVNGFGYSKL